MGHVVFPADTSTMPIEGGHKALQRRLAAILAADVIDYSRLMGEDQVRTLDALRQMRRELFELFEPLVADHRGNIIKSMGDGWIVDFPSVSDAVGCALHVQEGLDGHEHKSGYRQERTFKSHRSTRLAASSTLHPHSK